jgi:hypothetical protein
VPVAPAARVAAIAAQFCDAGRSASGSFMLFLAELAATVR